MKNTQRSIQTVVVFLILISSVFAEENAPTINTKLVSVSLFKNGLGFVRREADLVKNNGFVVFDKLPIPIHGTFWVQPIDKNIGVTDLIAYMQESTEEKTATTIPELLEANIGEVAEVRIGDTNIQCKLVSIPTNQQAKINETTVSSRSSYQPQDAGSIILLQTSNLTFAVNKSDIKQLGRASGDIKTSIKRPKKQLLLK